MRVARRYLVSGRVQGVGFRFFAKTVAKREGVNGWVRNLADGRVEIQAEGEAEAIDRFGDIIRRGPQGSTVSSLRCDEVTPVAEAEGGFRIR